ncbi:MAG TPA: hypothetical protein H9913_07595 [Candidatus Blautia stercoripullorum]|uniref:Nbr1 FW domain-containing protein n=1 Tax=Candidatus Blautia stercoripullorum TaxID=2838502 RepID=A0A9D2RB51_9FIRM|nr:hypothetical protein [Candidatus Blautia stercoripullorum]
MNLKGIYEIFYPGREQKYLSVWKKETKYRSKKDFFEEVFPTELRWLSIKLWNDKARRSRFFTDCKMEKNYVSALKNYILQNPMVISRMENKCYLMLKNDLFSHLMNQIFFRLVEQEQISLSPALEKYLIDEGSNTLKSEWGNMLTFLILYAIFPEEVNQLYIPYLYGKENALSYGMEEKAKKDSYLFQYEYPPDMSVYKPNEWLTHTWVIKNVGKIPWEHRRFECVCSPDWLNEENRRIEMTGVIYPGDTVALTVHFRVPNVLEHYVLHWKMRNRWGDLVFCNKVGLGLHFTVLEEDREVYEKEENNYQILEEKPTIPATLIAGKLYKHNWIIENTGTVTWEDYYCESINGDVWGYAKNELRIPMKKKVEPGECVGIQIEFVTPPIEGNYKLLWRIMKKGGKPAFQEGRQLEIILNLV